MKSQRRHDLKQSALGNELVLIRDFLKRRGNLLAWIALAVALVILVVVYVRGREQGRLTSVRVQWEHYKTQEQNPEARFEDLLVALKPLAEQDVDRRIAVQATLRMGDHYLLRSILGQTAGPEQQEVGRPLSRSEQKELADKAAEQYRQALQDFSDMPVFAARAHVGLAKLAETRGEFDQAAKHYQSAIDLKAPAVSQVAQEGLARLVELKSPVRMATTAPAPKLPVPQTLPSAEPATRPATQPAPAATRPAAAPAPATRPAPPPAGKPAAAPTRPAAASTQPAPAGAKK